MPYATPAKTHRYRGDYYSALLHRLLFSSHCTLHMPLRLPTHTPFTLSIHTLTVGRAFPPVRTLLVPGPEHTSAPRTCRVDLFCRSVPSGVPAPVDYHCDADPPRSRITFTRALRLIPDCN